MWRAWQRHTPAAVQRSNTGALLWSTHQSWLYKQLLLLQTDAWPGLPLGSSLPSHFLFRFHFSQQLRFHIETLTEGKIVYHRRQSVRVCLCVRICVCVYVCTSLPATDQWIWLLCISSGELGLRFRERPCPGGGCCSDEGEPNLLRLTPCNKMTIIWLFFLFASITQMTGSLWCHGALQPPAPRRLLFWSALRRDGRTSGGRDDSACFLM